MQALMFIVFVVSLLRFIVMDRTQKDTTSFDAVTVTAFFSSPTQVA